MNQELERLKACGFTVVEIPLSAGRWAKIDISDAPAILQHKWSTSRHTNVGGAAYFYAHRRTASNKHITLHREILNCGKGKLVDHANHDTLDNRRSNIRICTRSSNNSNSVGRVNKCGFRGIHFIPLSNLYQSQIGHANRNLTGGSFKNPEDAARDYDQLAIKLHGEFAVTNEMLGKFKK